jgi:drug/metabolite transporter (DMT)-like permease
VKIATFLKQKKDKIGLPILALIWISIAWGTTWIASKEGIKHMPSLQLATLRQFIAGVIFVGFFMFKKAVWPNRNQWKTIVILAFLNFVFSNGLSLWGLQFISSGLGAIIGTLFPIWIIMISFFRGEKISNLAIKGMLLSFIGICVIFGDYLSDFLKPDFRLGIFVSLIATVTWAFATLYTKEKAASFNPYFSLGLQMLVSSAVLFLGTTLAGTTVSITEIPTNAWLSIGYLVIIGSVFTFVAYIYALQNLPTELNSIYVYINPIVALIIGVIYNNEPFSVLLLSGGFITLIGLYLVNKSIRNKKKMVTFNPEN